MRSVESLETAPAYQRTAKQLDEAAAGYREARSAHWDSVAVWTDTRRGLSGAYHRRLAQVFGFLCPPGLRVLEVGSGNGDLLASLHPSSGVGLDFAPEMIARARQRHPELTFLQA